MVVLLLQREELRDLAATTADAPGRATHSSFWQVDQWVDYIVKEVVMGSGVEAVLSSLNSYLAFRSYLVGYALTLADVVLWGQLQGRG